MILTGCLSLILGSCVYELAVTFNHANLVLVQFMVKSMDVMSRIPFANIKIDDPPLWLVFLWYGLLAIWVFCWRYVERSQRLDDSRQNAEPSEQAAQDSVVQHERFCSGGVGQGRQAAVDEIYGLPFSAFESNQVTCRKQYDINGQPGPLCDNTHLEDEKK